MIISILAEATTSDDLSQDVSISCESEYKDYIYNETVDIWTLVSLKAPKEVEEDDEDKRAPIDLVAVIDKSGSMEGEKLKLVKKTLEFVLTQCKFCFDFVTFNILLN